MDSVGRALKPVFRFASRPTDDADLARFLRRRLLVHLRVMAAVFGGIYVVGVVGLAVFMPSQVVAVHRHPAKIMNAVLPVVLLAVWAWLHGREVSALVTRVCDFMAQLCIGIGLGIGVGSAPAGYRFELVGLFMFVFTLVVRAALVPSSVGWTATIGLVCSLPVVIGGYWQAAKSPPLDWVTPPFVAAGLL